MFFRTSSPAVQNRPRSNSHPAPPQRGGRTDESPPARPPRNPARPVTFGEEQLVPLSHPASKLTTASGDIDYFRKRGREIGPEERNGQSVNVTPPKSLVNRKQPPQATPLPQINTLDRKILQELRQSMLARSAQFTLKNGTKHHPFPPEEVPYPRSYDHKCIDTDVWETLFCEQFCGNVTFHTFDVPPTKVLDLGCGSGSWIMSCARRWKNCHFVGLDIVPLHPDLGQSELSQRVNWVQASFLEPLPFPNEEFDFVHIKRIARGVPENKWDALFEEIIRVMKPGAALEMLEEDLYIPGQTIDSADNDSPLSPSSSSGSPDEQSQISGSPVSGPSTSLPDIFTGQGSSSSHMIRRSTSERVKGQSANQSPSNTHPPPFPGRQTPPVPDPSRAFPRPRTSKSTIRPTASHFNLHNLLSGKRSGRDDGAKPDGEQQRKNKKETFPPVASIASLYTLSVSGSSTTLDQKHSPKMHRPSSAGGGPPLPKPYFNTGGTSSNLMSGSNTSINLIPMPVPQLHKRSGRDRPLTLPPAETTSGELEVSFTRNGQNEESKQARARSFSCPTPEEDGQRRTTASRESEQFDLSTVGMHDHVQQVRSSHVRNPRNSAVLTDTEPVEPTRQDKRFVAVLPAPPPLPRDIPIRSKPQGIPSGAWSGGVSGSTDGLPRSAPERVADYSDQTGDQLSPTFGAATKPMKSLSTSSLGICSSPILRSPIPEIPTNPRQHNLLEVIYSEMHAARFVNLAPLSLLENYVRTYFKNVRTHAPLIFAFPPPPGCDHRPEFDAVELQHQTQGAKYNDDQDRYLRPDTLPSTRLLTPSPSVPQLNILKSLPPHPTRLRSLSVNAEPGPSRPRPSTIRVTHSLPFDPETTNQQQLLPGSSDLFAGPGDGTVPGRLIVTGGGLLAGTNEYVMMDMSMVGGLPPARVAKAARESASSASDERERSRQRSDSLFTHSKDVKGKGGGSEGRKRSFHKLTRPSTARPSPPPSSFEYESSKAISSASLSPSLASSSSSTSTIVQHDSGKGKRGLTVAEGAQLSPLPNKRAEIDIKNLNLHLRVRVVEILGCSEAMWDWVKVFQHQESEKEKKRKAQVAKKVQGVGGGRVSYFHHDHVRQAGARGRVNSGGGGHPALRHQRSSRGLATGVSREKRSEDRSSLNGGGQGTSGKVSGYLAESPTSYFTTSSGSVKEEDPSERMKKVKQELLHMTRDRFDEALAWFQFDMDDSIRLTRSMATRTPSVYFSADPAEQRKSFDSACQKLEIYLQQHPDRPSPLTKANSIASGNWSIGGSSRHSQPYEEELCCLPPLLNLVHPSKRLCRTIRVWVAWKP